MNRIQARQRIVVWVDCSDASASALRWAAREAELRGAGLYAVCAWENARRHRAPYAAVSGVPRQEEEEEERAAAAAVLAGAVHAALGPTLPAALHAEVVEGRAERVLLDCATGADLLVLGSTGRAAQLGMDPVHRTCLYHLPCPVVVVNGGTMVV